VVALPGVEGPRIPGTTQNDAGFILVGANGQMGDSDCVWAAGDAIAYTVKFGGLASQQADAVAADVAARASGGTSPAPAALKLRGVLMTGATPRRLGGASPSAPSDHRPFWRPEAKVSGKYLTPYLERLEVAVDPGETAAGVVVQETLPGVESGEPGTFHALWRAEHGSPEYLQRLGREIHDYEATHERAAEVLREHGQLGGPRRGSEPA
jgi:hypothetical protein